MVASHREWDALPVERLNESVATPSERQRFLVSYRNVSPDKEWAEWIAWHLEEAGHEASIQAWDLHSGQSVVRFMHRGVEEHDRTIAVVSPRYFDSDFTAVEWESTVAKDITGDDCRLLMARIEPMDVPGLLGRLVWFDLFTRGPDGAVASLEPDEARRRLLKAIPNGRRKPTQPPPMPGQQRPRVPGTLPPIWNVPHARNPNFEGREELLQGLGDRLRTGTPTAVTQAIHGQGGVGKTQLATEYVYRNLGQYDLIWWLRAEDPASLVADYARLAQELDVAPDDATELDAAAQAARSALERRHGWLLVLDNAEHPDAVQPYLPRSATGHTLLTSRYPDWGGGHAQVSVDLFTPDEATSFLVKRTGQDDCDTAERLAEELGRLPLAVAQASAYIAQTRIPFDQYLELYRARRRELWANETPPDGYHATVATTWNLSLQQLHEEDPAAEHLLYLLAHLAPDDLPIDLLPRAAEHAPDRLKETLRDSLRLRTTLGALHQYALANVEGDSVSVHRLLQAVVRDRLGPDEARMWAGVGVRFAAAVFKFTPEKAHLVREYGLLVPLVRAAVENAEPFTVEPEATGRALDRLGKFFQVAGRFEDARTNLEQSLRIAEETYGPNHPEVATALSNLALVLNDLGDFEIARTHLECVLLIDQEVHGPEHPSMAVHLNNLATVLYNLGDSKTAKTHLERALRIHEDALGLDHPEVATFLSNLAAMFQDLGDPKTAKTHLERALRIDEKNYGPNHPTVAVILDSLALVLKDIGDPKTAKTHLERALRIHEEAFGPHHPEVATRLNNLAMAFQDLGDPKTAKTHLERALRIHEETFGPTHPRVAAILNNLALVLQVLGDSEAAKTHLEQALRITEEFYGPTHPRVATSLNNLATMFQDLGDLNTAKTHLERALRIDEKTYGPNHPTVATDLSNLATVIYNLADSGTAQNHWRRARAILFKVFGPDHPQTQTVEQFLDEVGR